jgi:hypothetical protein
LLVSIDYAAIALRFTRTDPARKARRTALRAAGRHEYVCNHWLLHCDATYHAGLIPMPAGGRCCDRNMRDMPHRDITAAGGLTSMTSTIRIPLHRTRPC